MLQALRTLEVWALAVWVGSLFGFAFVFAPVAFSHLSNDLDTFASIIGGTLGAVTLLGYVCGAIAIVISLIAAAAGRSRWAIVAAACIAIMLGLTAFSENAIVPAMVQTQSSFHAPFNAIAKNDPRRVRYDALHQKSSEVYGAVLLLGFIALALCVRSDPSERRI
ncbi:MAG: DUF4149 domain-containing protein [Vulcanimicrobiaceae bacterium]